MSTNAIISSHRDAVADSAWIPGIPVLPYLRQEASVDREDFVKAMGVAVTGVNVVTTDGLTGKFGLTVSAMSSLSADPPMLLVCINRGSPVCEAVSENMAFCVNVLSTHQRHVADRFAGRPQRGQPYDFNHDPWEKGRAGLPTLGGAVSVFECTVETSADFGSHTLFIGRVIAVGGDGGNALLYTSRAYGHPCQWR